MEYFDKISMIKRNIRNIDNIQNIDNVDNVDNISNIDDMDEIICGCNLCNSIRIITLNHKLIYNFMLCIITFIVIGIIYFSLI